jgi:hypothetical protein
VKRGEMLKVVLFWWNLNQNGWARPFGDIQFLAQLRDPITSHNQQMIKLYKTQPFSTHKWGSRSFYLLSKPTHCNWEAP